MTAHIGFAPLFAHDAKLFQSRAPRLHTELQKGQHRFPHSAGLRAQEPKSRARGAWAPWRTSPTRTRRPSKRQTGAADSDQHSFAGSLEVPLEVEEEAHAPPAKEAPKDAPAFEVKRRKLQSLKQHS